MGMRMGRGFNGTYETKQGNTVWKEHPWLPTTAVMNKFLVSAFLSTHSFFHPSFHPSLVCSVDHLVHGGFLISRTSDYILIVWGDVAAQDR